MFCVDSGGSVEIWIRQVGIWVLWQSQGQGSCSGLYESKNLANFLMRFLIRIGVPSLMLIFWDSPHLEQHGSAAPLWKFHHSSQSQKSDRLFLKDFGNSWTSLEEGPPHCLHRGQGQNHECGLWFRDWSLNNLEEFVFGLLVLAYCNYFLVFISYILIRCLSSMTQWIKKYMTQPGAKIMEFCFVLWLLPIPWPLFHDPRKTVSMFHGRGDDYH